MLKAPKKIANLSLAQSHEDLFAENYDVLLGWARKFTQNEDQQAQDLLHDTFIHFTLARPDMAAVENLEGYLYIVMRNLHLSQIRKATRTPGRSMSAVDFDTVDVGMWASDPRDRLRMRDELAAVCQYACVRKESSKGGSVLILRFFHGYYPEEIAGVLKTTRAVIYERLRHARLEAKDFVENPNKFGETKLVKLKVVEDKSDLRRELRRSIFESCHGKHVEDVEGTYQATGPDTRPLAHIVSCPNCIENVNTLLDLPPLASRYPLDTIGNDPGSKRGGGDDGPGGHGTGGAGMLDGFTSRRDAHFYHEPQELCIAVNGQLQGYQKVVNGRGELTLILDNPEPLGFVEVFSEQDLRLLLLNVEPPPVGDGKQSTFVNLSSGRTVEAQLSFSGAHPALHVTYNDPELAAMLAPEMTEAPNVLAEVNEDQPVFSTLESQKGFDWRAWFAPMRLAIACTVLVAVLAGIWFVSQPTGPEVLTARAVLAEARKAEFSMAPTAERVLHRNYQVEEWANGSLKSRKRIDEWQQAKVAARRTYDESGQMVVGVWTKEDGSQRVFVAGERLRDVYKRDVKNDTGPEPTANSFSNLVDRHGVVSRVVVQEDANQYVFSFEDRQGETAQAGISERLIAASLTIDRETYRPISQTLVLQIGGEVREYRFSDVRVEQKLLIDVSPLIFQPEAELAKGATTITKPLDIEMPSVPPAVAGGESKIVSTTATLDTEVEVFRALDSVNALSGDQISITRTAGGQLKVVGIVDGNQRKTEILNALSDLKNSPGLMIDVQTATEAAAKQKQQVTGDNITLESRTADVSRQSPVEAELRAHFNKRGVAGDALDSEVRNFTSAVLNRAEALSRNALALKSLAERFSPAELGRLDTKKRDDWKRLVRSKAAAVSGDVRSLQSQLSLFGGGALGGSGGDVKDAAGSAQRLFGLAAACERQINQSFALTGSSSGAAPVKSVQFWRNLGQMADIAAELQKF